MFPEVHEHGPVGGAEVSQVEPGDPEGLGHSPLCRGELRYLRVQGGQGDVLPVVEDYVLRARLRKP